MIAAIAKPYANITIETANMSIGKANNIIGNKAANNCGIAAAKGTMKGVANAKPRPSIIIATPRAINAKIPAPNIIAPIPLNIIIPKANTAIPKIINAKENAIIAHGSTPANKENQNAAGMSAIPKIAKAIAPRMISFAPFAITLAIIIKANNVTNPIATCGH